MSRIDLLKSRLEDIFLRDRGNLDEKSAALIKDELARTLRRFFILTDCSVKFFSSEDGSVQIDMHAVGRRLHTEKD